MAVFVADFINFPLSTTCLKNKIVHSLQSQPASSCCSLTDTRVPPEDVPVEDVEGEVSEATWDLAVEVLPVEGTRHEKTQGELYHTNVASHN